MADRSAGPVKPPVIDLTARNTNARPEDRPAGESARPAPSASTGPAWPLLGGAAVGGAVLGTLLTYLLSNLVPLPSGAPDLTSEIAAQGQRLDTLGSSLTALEDRTARTQISLDATIVQLDTGFGEVNQSIADVRAAIPELPAPVDLAPIEAQIRTLRAQVEAIAAGASGGDATAIAEAIATLETGFADLGGRLDGVDTLTATLRTDLDAARQRLTDHIDQTLPTEVGPALKLPLILSGLESAFAAGRPYRAELDSLAGILPDFEVPAPLAAAAASGLARPDAIHRRFQAVIPEILAARDPSGEDWTQSVIDWTSGLLALRPADEIEGDGAAAVMSRLEAAVERRDYAAAASLIAALPPAMRDKAGTVAADIDAHAAAIAFVSGLRTRALETASDTP